MLTEGNKINQERITAKGVDIWVERPNKVTKIGLTSGAEKLGFIDLTPNNMLKPDGETLKLIVGDGISVELSKRRSTMPFWHRNMEFDEVIICIKGQAEWKTETGEFELNAGELLLIPRGISHTAISDSNSDYAAIEIKSRTPIATKQ